MRTYIETIYYAMKLNITNLPENKKNGGNNQENNLVCLVFALGWGSIRWRSIFVV